MKDKLKIFGEISKKILKELTFYSIILLSCGASFCIGYYYKSINSDKKCQKIVKSQVNIAVDEHDNLIIIDNHSGNYTIYQDSIGLSIFSLYTKNIWNQHLVSGPKH